MKERVVAFFADLDRALAPHAAGRELDVYHIGRSSFWWEYSGRVVTGDVDVVFQPDGPTDLIELATTGFGDGTANAARHGLYLQRVEAAYPPVTASARRRAKPAPGPWTTIRVWYLEPIDLAVTKLTRFAARDRDDIRLLCDLDLIDPDELERRLEVAYYFSLDKDGDPRRDAAFANLRKVQTYLRTGTTAF